MAWPMPRVKHGDKDSFVQHDVSAYQLMAVTTSLGKQPSFLEGPLGTVVIVMVPGPAEWRRKSYNLRSQMRDLFSVL